MKKTISLKVGCAAILAVSSSYSGPKPFPALAKLALVPVMVCLKKSMVKRTAELVEVVVFMVMSFLGSWPWR